MIPLRPKTKEELLEVATLRFDELWKLFDELWKLFDGMNEGEQNGIFAFDEIFLAKNKETHWRRNTKRLIDSSL